MGHLVRYVFNFEKDQKKHFDKLIELLEDEGEIADSDNWSDKYGGQIDIEWRCGYSFDIKDWLSENGFKGKCSIEIYYLERDPDEIISYEGEKDV